MNIGTKFYLPTMFQSWAMDPSLRILKVYYKSQHHSSVAIFIDCVYALNKNTHA